MLVERGFEGSAIHLRRLVRGLRPTTREAFLVLRSIPGERGEVDWADFGKVTLGRAERRLSAFVMTLSQCARRSSCRYPAGLIVAEHTWSKKQRFDVIANTPKRETPVDFSTGVS